MKISHMIKKLVDDINESVYNRVRFSINEVNEDLVFTKLEVEVMNCGGETILNGRYKINYLTEMI